MTAIRRPYAPPHVSKTALTLQAVTAGAGVSGSVSG